MNYSEKIERAVAIYFETGVIPASDQETRNKAVQVILYEIHKKLKDLEQLQSDKIELTEMIVSLQNQISKKK